MKTIVIIIALAGFTAVGSYAQNKDCCCNKAVQKVTQSRQPAPPPLCFLTTVDNAGIEKCVNATYDNTAGVLQYESEKPYTGYYPVTVNKANKVVATKKAVWQKASCAVKPMEPTVKTTTGEDQPLQGCYTYRQHNIVVKDCPNVFYDREGWMLDNSGLDVKSDNTYMGYYPKPDVTNVAKPVIPENENKADDESNKSSSPGDNLCFWNCK